MAYNNYQSKGLGDTIARITNRLGIRQCGGCKKRQSWLNKNVSYNNSLSILANALNKSQKRSK